MFEEPTVAINFQMDAGLSEASQVRALEKKQQNICGPDDQGPVGLTLCTTVLEQSFDSNGAAAAMVETKHSSHVTTDINSTDNQ